MKLYNTLTRQIETVNPINPPSTTVYTCGPTVYDYPHIGNWFTFLRYDLLIRALRVDGLQPKWVMNITDVGHLVSDADEGEDKLEKGAKREGKTAWDVAAFYADYFTKGLQRLNIVQPDVLPKATEHIQEQIDLIKSLEQKGFTYVIEDGVYYDTSKFPGYAEFAKLDLDDLQAGARIEHNPEKRNVSDFALWKLTPPGVNRDMEWDSPWGKGFPGWHLECSAMCMKYLGDTVDIHSGGIDHIPVHHTNEIAQSEAVTGQRFANYWMHTNHISVNGEKISKSLGNGITLEDIEQKGFDFETLRLHVFESHYRSQSKFSWESLEAAKNRLNAYRAMADQRWQVTDNDGILADMIDATWNDIKSQITNDLDTPSALATLSRLEAQIDAHGVAAEALEPYIAFLGNIDDILGLTLSTRQDIGNEEKSLIVKRQTARDNKDWATSDALRDRLASDFHITIKDTSRGQIWSRNR